MIDKHIFAALSVLLSLIGYGSYLRSIARGHTRPHIFSWGVWSILLLIVFCAQWSAGGGAGSWATGVSGIACIIIAIAALKRGEKNITRSDCIAFVGALLAIPLWRITHDALAAVILATLIDGLAYFPTFRKSWSKPWEENYFTYTMDMVKWVAAMAALENYGAVTLLYPCFLFTANGALVTMIITRRRLLPRKA